MTYYRYSLVVEIVEIYKYTYSLLDIEIHDMLEAVPEGERTDIVVSNEKKRPDIANNMS